MNKRGELAESIKSISGIVLGIAALLIVLAVLYTIFSTFFFEKGPDAETKQSIEGLKDALSDLGGEGDYLFRFSEGYSLIVFEKGKGSHGSGQIGWYIRPSSCFDDACIILCKDSEDKNACLKSKYVINLDANGFITENEKGIVYPFVIDDSNDEWLLLKFSKINEQIKIVLSKA